MKSSQHHHVKQFHSILLDLHKDLLDYQGEILSNLFERKLSPYELWDLSLKSEQFSWLRKISELIVIMDETIDQDEIEIEFVNWLKKEVKEIFYNDPETEFRLRLANALEKRPDLHFLLGRMKKLTGL